MKVSTRIPKPFSIESLISNKESDPSPPSPPCSSSPTAGSPLGMGIPSYHPAILPFPLYNPWIAGYLSQQTNSDRINQFISESTMNHTTNPLQNPIDPANYLLAHHKEKLTQFLNANTIMNSANNKQIHEIFSDFSNNGYFTERSAKIFTPNSYNNTPCSDDNIQYNNKEFKENRNLDIESMDSCSSDISMSSSPDGSCSNKNQGMLNSQYSFISSFID